MRPVVVLEPPSWRRVRPLDALRRLGRSRDLLWTLTRHRLEVRYKHTQLGFAWAILQPLVLMMVFTLVFSLLGRSPAGEAPYPLFAYAALVPWTAFASGLSNGTAALTGHAALLTKVYFPREILPLSYVAAALADFTAASLVLLALMGWYGVAPTIYLLGAIPAVAVLAAFLTALSLLLSAIHVRLRDVGTAMPLLLQVWMFASPVLYPIELVRDNLSPSLYVLYTLNPLAGVVDGVRRAVLGLPPDAMLLATGAAVSIAILVPAYLYFKRVEATMADVV
jgi:lipopolysaccharide transport system permease protein